MARSERGNAAEPLVLVLDLLGAHKLRKSMLTVPTTLNLHWLERSSVHKN